MDILGTISRSSCWFHHHHINNIVGIWHYHPCYVDSGIECHWCCCSASEWWCTDYSWYSGRGFGDQYECDTELDGECGYIITPASTSAASATCSTTGTIAITDGWTREWTFYIRCDEYFSEYSDEFSWSW